MSNTAFDIPGRTFADRVKSYVHRNGREIEFQYAVTYKFASGGMVSTAEDLARFGIALLHGKLLKPETLA
jgi:serine beta-lactamase-like protein LACTB, mitochondrial